VAAYVDDGHRTWQGAAGVADLRTHRPLRADDRYRAASNTKTFVATVALQLVDEGKLRLTDTVQRWLPGVLPYGNQVTVRNLLNHTAGIPDNSLAPDIQIYKGDPLRQWTPAELVALVSSQPQEFPTGSKWAYSNTGYTLAGMIIERAGGHTLQSEIERRIIRPLHLDDTSFPVSTPFLDGHFARGYSLDYDDDLNPVPGTLRDLTVRTPSGIWAAGNLVTNLGDLAHFFRAVLRGRLFSAARLADMKTLVETGSEGTRYGLGLFAWDTQCGTLYGHGGGMPGYENSFQNSEDGSRQSGTLLTFSVAPDAVNEAFGPVDGEALNLLCR
jgi:D-alanyl-D-alanine carboxypeptidase